MITIDEFYLCLKLDIWRKNDVENWGMVESLSVADANVRKDYMRQPLAKKHIGTGLYLLDLLLLDSDNYTGKRAYMVVIAVCRNTLEHIKTIYYLKVSNKMDLRMFENVIINKKTLSKAKKNGA